jgi:cell shape-determining protein MreD
MTGRLAEFRPALIPRLLVLVVITTMLHSGVFAQVRVLGIMPETLLLVTVLAALETGPNVGVAVGFLAGLAVAVVDLDAPLGVAAFLFAITGWTIGIVRDYAFPGAGRVPFALVIVSSVIVTGLYGLLLAGARGMTVTALFHVGRAVLIVPLLNCLIGIALRPIVRIVLGVNWNEVS